MFYDNYVKLCEEHGEKPTPVAQKLGCSSSNVALWKKGSVPRSATLSKIAEYFGVTTQYLLFGQTDTPKTKKDTTLSGDVGMPEGYAQLTPANREIVDRLIADLAKTQSKP